MRRILVLAIAAAALIVAGCGSSSSAGSSGSAGGRYPAGAATSATVSGGQIQVALQNISFLPATVKAKVGQTVVWTNMDNVDHNVTATSGASFHSSDFGQGQTYSMKMTKAGTIKYVCTIHAGMHGTIVVTS